MAPNLFHPPCHLAGHPSPLCSQWHPSGWWSCANTHMIYLPCPCRAPLHFAPHEPCLPIGCLVHLPLVLYMPPVIQNGLPCTLDNSKILCFMFIRGNFLIMLITCCMQLHLLHRFLPSISRSCVRYAVYTPVRIRACQWCVFS